MTLIVAFYSRGCVPFIINVKKKIFLLDVRDFMNISYLFSKDAMAHKLYGYCNFIWWSVEYLFIIILLRKKNIFYLIFLKNLSQMSVNFVLNTIIDKIRSTKGFEVIKSTTSLQLKSEKQKIKNSYGYG